MSESVTMAFQVQPIHGYTHSPGGVENTEQFKHTTKHIHDVI